MDRILRQRIEHIMKLLGEVSVQTQRLYLVETIDDAHTVAIDALEVSGKLSEGLYQLQEDCFFNNLNTA